MPQSLSYLDLVNELDGFPSAILNPTAHTERLSTLMLFTSGTHTLGYVLPSVVTALRALSSPHWTITPSTVSLTGHTVDERSTQMRTTLESFRDAQTFAVCSGKGWRNELYSVYSPNGELYLEMERSGAALFGVVQYGVHMTAFVRADGGLKIWTPRRNPTKSTYPSMLDNTVAGGIASGMTVFETLIKESAEEASLPESLVREKARCVGLVSYFMVRDHRAGGETGLLMPEVQYVYDMEVGDDVVPRPGDDEVQDFHLLTMDEVVSELRAGRFKPNCAVVLIDFFIRHGIITPENEPDYIEISSRIHRTLEFPLAKYT
ncbi:NUDIX hydrolase domain-like protein [Tricharina praecox]|uniref:NUDIX hydrolase domain-like protein n=1 Tax=Tricharina praecox TaxID=43433 RepID=UPI00222076A2|nr:NUDIX hydrolase domain-like protein [Tricharina praecox]KAI5846052.1 NUDIX hydrolase domain-like protein [Tricharina praecox]